jgi:sensor histidine kinase YesM
MNLLLKSKYHKATHFLFWVAVWCLFFFFFSYNATSINFALSLASFLIPITAGVTYVMVKQLIPKFLLTKQYVKFGIYSFISLLITSFFILLFLILSVALIPEFKAEDLPPLGKNYAFIIMLVYMVVALVSFATIWKRNSEMSLANTQLQKELYAAKFEAKKQELNYLKSQIHPHFLFNTLNTIYGLALKKSEVTPDVILKLSNLLDYILYETNKPTVSVLDEIRHLEDYITLEKIRFSDTLKVSFSKEADQESVQIPPILLLPFVENAFKHGQIQNGFLEVDIKLLITNNNLHFTTKNTSSAKEYKDGLGLTNIKERLQLLFPENFELDIKPTQNWFEVDLIITNFNQFLK